MHRGRITTIAITTRESQHHLHHKTTSAKKERVKNERERIKNNKNREERENQEEKTESIEW